MTPELSWPLPGDLTDDALENRLFARADVKQGLLRLLEPNCAQLAPELKKPDVTLMILWEEYHARPSQRLWLQPLCCCQIEATSRSAFVQCDLPK